MLGVKTKRDQQFEILDGRLIDIQGRLAKIRQSQHDQAELEKNRYDAIIQMLSPIADLPFIREELSTIHGLLTNPPQSKPLEVKFMFVVKDDETDKNFSVVTGDVTDAEGNVIPEASVDLEVASTDDAVVGVTFDPSTKSGSVHFGNPGTATITAKASSGGKLLGSGAADFTVTVGDPAAISNVGLSFDGLTEV